jgi:hypothetical protein
LATERPQKKRNEFYFSIDVSEEQIAYAQKLVDYSLKHHPVSNIWDKEKKIKPGIYA